MLASAREAVPTYRSRPGWSEIKLEESNAALEATLTAVARDPAVRRDAPVAISFSSSGREVFPVDELGVALGPCLMTADTRGDEVAAQTASRRSPEEWFRLTGHVPRRMDPINRALWWREHHPAVAARTRWFMNWHEYYSLLLTGRPVVDASDAAAWATYEVASGDWSRERIAETGVDPRWLPDIQANASPIGPISEEAARRYGLPADVLIVTGAWDAFAASVGCGAVDPGVINLSCGTWHSFTVPVRAGWPVELVHEDLTVAPHPGPTGFGALSTDPNGTAVIDWARALLKMEIPELEAGLAITERGPSAVRTDAALTPLPRRSGTLPGATFEGVTLATTRIDLVRALLEAIALEFADTIRRLGELGVPSTLVRATGGGSRLAWWLQLHSDLCGIPFEVVAQDEPGAFGAAILAGVGAGIYPSVSAAVERLVRVSRRFEPDAGRGALYGPRRGVPLAR